MSRLWYSLLDNTVALALLLEVSAKGCFILEFAGQHHFLAIAIPAFTFAMQQALTILL